MVYKSKEWLIHVINKDYPTYCNEDIQKNIYSDSMNAKLYKKKDCPDSINSLYSDLFTTMVLGTIVKRE